MNKKPKKQSGPGKFNDTHVSPVSEDKSKFTFPAPQKKRRKTTHNSSPDRIDLEAMEDLEWRMGL